MRTRIAVLLAAALAAACSSDARRAREAWAPAVEKTPLEGVEAALSGMKETAAQIGRDLGEGNYGKARAGAAEAERAAALLADYYAPLLRAKEETATAYKLLRLGESAAVADAAERAAERIEAAAKAAPEPARAPAMAALSAELRGVRAQMEKSPNVARYKLEEAAARVNDLLAPRSP